VDEQYVIGVDPGDTTGWVILKRNGGECVRLGQTRADDMPGVITKAFKEYSISEIVYEEFVLYANRAQAQQGSRFFASQVVGMLKFAAYQNGNIPTVSQPAQVLKTAELISGVKQPGDHSKSHHVDAFNHAYYWLVKHHLAQSVLEKEAAEARKLDQSPESEQMHSVD